MATASGVFCSCTSGQRVSPQLHGYDEYSHLAAGQPAGQQAKRQQQVQKTSYFGPPHPPLPYGNRSHGLKHKQATSSVTANAS